MFKLDLDLNLLFAPPMDDYGQGIILTRTVSITIQPMSGLFLCGRVLEESGPTDMGFKLEDVKWDLDREVFLATTSLTHVDLPLAFIPDILRAYVSLGWRIGSYTDQYEEDQESSAKCSGQDTALMRSNAQPEMDNKTLEILHTLPQSRRPKEFNRMFKAIIREMALTGNNLPTAYAMDKLRRLVEIPEDRQRLAPASRTPLEKKWIDTCYQFRCLAFDQQWKWRERVMNTYPAIEDVI